MKRVFTLLIFLFFISAGLFSQSLPAMEPNLTLDGKKEGKWVIWYNDEFNQTLLEDSAVYYLEVLFKNDKPDGKVRGFYKSGKLHWEGNMLSVAPDVFDRDCVWYYENGDTLGVGAYEMGEPVGVWYRFKEDGSLENTIDFSLKKKEDVWKTTNEKALDHFHNYAYEEAIPFAEAGLNYALEEFGNDHEFYLISLNNLALLSKLTGRNDEAVSLYLEVLESTERVYGKDHYSYGLCLSDIAVLYEDMGEYFKALPYSIDALENAERTLGKEHAEYGIRLNNLAGLYKITGSYDKALPLYLQAMGLAKKTPQENGLSYEIVLNNLAVLYEAMGKYSKALPLYLEAREITETTVGKDHLNYGIRLNNLAGLYKLTGEYEMALQLYRESVENAEKTIGKNNSDYAIRLNNLAGMYDFMGEYSKSMTYYQEALAIIESTLGKNHPDYGTVLNNLAVLYEAMGNYQAALFSYAVVLENAEATLGKTHPDYGIRLNNVAKLYKKTGNYSQALQLYDEALEIVQNSLGKNHPDCGVILNNLAGLNQALGNEMKALTLYLESLEITESALGKNHPEVGIRLNNLAEFYTSIGEYALALPYHLEALEITVNTVGKNHPEYGSRLNNLATLYLRTGDYDKALPLYLEATENTQNTLGKDHAEYATCLNNLALVYDYMGKTSKAIKLYKKALEKTEKTLGKDHLDYAVRLNNLAGSYAYIGKYEKAYSLFLESLTNLNFQINHVFSFLPESGKERFVEFHQWDIQSFQSFCHDYYPQNEAVAESAYQMELLTKGLILNSGLDLQKRVYASDDTELKAKFEKLLVYKKELAQEYGKPIANREEDLHEWEEKTEKLESEVNRRTNFLSEMQQVGKVSVKDIQDELNENEVAVEFSTFRYYDGQRWTDTTQYSALILRNGDSLPKFVPLFTQNQLDEIADMTGSEEGKVNALYRGSVVVSAKQDYGKLYDLIWKPLEKHLKKGESIYFVPTGSLHQISFAAIKTPDGKYLSKVYDLIQLSTTAKILEKESHPEFKEIALFGGMDYDADLAVLNENNAVNQSSSISVLNSLPNDLIKLSSARGEGWNYLKGTRDEVDAIKAVADDHAIKTRFFTGNDATEENFKRLNGAHSPDMLHIATHGFFFEDPESKFKEIRGAETSDGAVSVFKLSENPLNRAGLLFSGANHSWKHEKTTEGIEDGILTAYEASQIYLPHTKLVVLSACETGLGEIKGSEGVFGLQRAFKTAGTRYLLMSLWKVPDKETAEFMEEFYKALFSSKNIEKSYKTAQTFMREKYPSDPYKWAAFVLIR